MLTPPHNRANYSYVTFGTVDEAQRACNALNMKENADIRRPMLLLYAQDAIYRHAGAKKPGGADADDLPTVQPDEVPGLLVIDDFIDADEER